MKSNAELLRVFEHGVVDGSIAQNTIKSRSTSEGAMASSELGSKKQSKHRQV